MGNVKNATAFTIQLRDTHKHFLCIRFLVVEEKSDRTELFTGYMKSSSGTIKYMHVNFCLAAAIGMTMLCLVSKHPGD